jgi:hypothetical protein
MTEVLFKYKNNHYSGTITEGFVVFAPYGGGFVSKMKISDFAERCEVIDALPNELIHAWVNIDSDKPFLAYVNPLDRWNGWAQPSFDLAAIKEVSESIIGFGYKCERVKGGYNISHNDDPEDVEFCEDYDIIHKDKTITVNGLCSGWCWDILSATQALMYLIADQDCYGYKTDTTKGTYELIFRSVFPSQEVGARLTDAENKILRDAIESAKTA